MCQSYITIELSLIEHVISYQIQSNNRNHIIFFINDQNGMFFSYQ